MNICQMLKCDVGNGPGFRVSIFVSGCTNRCKGCFNPETWDFNYGKGFDVETQDMVFAELSKPIYRGLTVLGGEPFEPCNQAGLRPFLERVRKELPEKDIWMYTGNVYEDLLPGGKKYTSDTDAVLSMADVLVDGRFVEELKEPGLKFRGSKNQRLIDLKKTRETGEVILLD